MKKGKVIITGIKPTKNDTFQLSLSQVVEDEDNVLGFFMQGHAGIAGAARNRVTWQIISKQLMEQYNFTVGDVLDEKIQRECNIQINEGFVARTWLAPDGTLQSQKPKINPKTNAVLRKNGNPIYRNSKVVFGKAVDTTLAHDVEVTQLGSAVPAATNDALAPATV